MFHNIPGGHIKHLQLGRPRQGGSLAVRDESPVTALRIFPLEFPARAGLASAPMFENVLLALRLLLRGEFRRVWREVHVRLYRPAWEFFFLFLRPGRVSGRLEAFGAFQVETNFRVAFESPDHLAPKGTASNNSTNKKFVLHMDEYLRRELKAGPNTLNFLDLGCSGAPSLVSTSTRVEALFPLRTIW